MNKEKYNIRPLKIEDVKFVVDIVRASFDSKYIIPSIYRGHGIEQFILFEMKNPFTQYKFFVLCEGSTIAGYSEYKVFENISTSFLNIIAVANDYKSKGIGKMLLNLSSSFFYEIGIKKIALDVYESNFIALKWYEKIGFKNVSITPFYKIDVDKDNTCDNFKGKIQNYSQFNAMMDFFGFYFLDIFFDNQNIKIGTINKSFIIRNSFSDAFKKQLPHLLNLLNFENAYYIGNESNQTSLKLIDRIIRMELIK